MKPVLVVLTDSRDEVRRGLASLDEKVFVVTADSSEKILSTIHEYISLMDIIETLIRNGAIIEDGKDYELAPFFVEKMIMRGLDDAMKDYGKGLTEDEMGKAIKFVEGFIVPKKGRRRIKGDID